MPWMYLVLIRDDVRKTFAHAQNKPRPFVEWGMTVIVLLIMFSYVRLPFENRLKTGVYFTNLKPAAEKIYHFALPLSSYGLTEQANILFRGKSVGHVVSLRGTSSSPDGVIVTGIISDPQMQLWSGDKARVIKTGLFSGSQLEIVRTAESGTELPGDSLIPHIDSKVALAETWSPTLASGEKPNLNKVRDEIKSRMDAGDYEGALQRQLWYFNHALEHGGVNPVRLSFGIMHWRELGRRYPKAQQALLAIRDRKTREFAAGRGYFDLFQEVEALNRELQDDAATLELFQRIEKQDSSLAAQCRIVVRSMENRMAGNSTAATNLSFGPVVERALLTTTSNAANLQFINFESGVVSTGTPPRSSDVMNDPALDVWLTANGADAVAYRWSDNDVLLFGYSRTQFASLSPVDWETLSPGALQSKSQELKLESAAVFPHEKSQFPATFLFKTSSGQLGLLQGLEYTDNPRGVKIRYKLVQNVPIQSGPMASAISPIYPPANEMLLADVHLSNPQKPQLLCLSNGAGFGTAQLFPGAKLGAKMLTQPQDIRQLRQRGIDIGCEVTAKTWGLVLWDCSIHAIGKIGWKTADAPDEKHAGWGNQSLNDIFRDMPMPKLDSYRVTTGDFPQTLLIKTRAGDCYVLEATGANINPPGVMIRYKRVQNEVIVKTKPTPSPAQLAESPKLQFLAWQDEWKTNKPFGAWQPDGSPVTNVTELAWLKEVHPGGMNVSALKLTPEPRFLHLWFSHPVFDRNQFTEFSLMDAAGNPIKLGGRGSAGGSQEASHRNGQLGWKTCTLSPGDGTNIPPRVTVQLRYTVGPLERTQELFVTPKTSTSMSLEGGSQLNGVGQNVDGRAFVAIAVDAQKMKARKFGVVAVAKDGRELSPAGSGSGGTVGGGVWVESYDFEIPLVDVAKFIIGTRPIRTNDWKDVVLRGN